MAKDKHQLLMEWYELYYEDIYRFILFNLGNRQYCEDLVHDTFVQAYSAIDRFESRSNIKTWLFSIAKHLVLDEIRRQKRRRLFSVIGIERDIPAGTNVEQIVENKDELLQAMKAIEKLRANYRMVVILKKVEEFSTKEIGEILGWSEAKVRKTLSRALQYLRKMEENKGGGQVEKSV